MVWEARRDWKQRRTLQEQDLEELRTVWAEGVSNGSGHFQDMDAIKAKARRRWTEQRRPG